MCWAVSHCHVGFLGQHHRSCQNTSGISRGRGVGTCFSIEILLVMLDRLLSSSFYALLGLPQGSPFSIGYMMTSLYFLPMLCPLLASQPIMAGSPPSCHLVHAINLGGLLHLSFLSSFWRENISSSLCSCTPNISRHVSRIIGKVSVGIPRQSLCSSKHRVTRRAPSYHSTHFSVSFQMSGWVIWRCPCSDTISSFHTFLILLSKDGIRLGDIRFAKSKLPCACSQ